MISGASGLYSQYGIRGGQIGGARKSHGRELWKREEVNGEQGPGKKRTNHIARIAERKKRDKEHALQTSQEQILERRKSLTTKLTCTRTPGVGYSGVTPCKSSSTFKSFTSEGSFGHARLGHGRQVRTRDNEGEHMRLKDALDTHNTQEKTRDSCARRPNL